jgi:hypothetical protein
VGVTVRVTDAANEPPGPEWDDLVVKADLPALWQSAPVHAYALACREVVLTVRVDLDGEAAMLAAYRSVQAGAGRRYRDLRRRPRPLALRCRPPAACLPGYGFVPGVREDERPRLLAAAEAAVRRWAGPWCRTVLYEWVPPADGPLFDGARFSARIAPAALLPVRWPDRDAYLASFPRQRRRRLRALVDRLDRDPSTVGFDLATDLGTVEVASVEMATRMRHTPLGRGAFMLPVAYLDAVVGTGRAGFSGFRGAGDGGELLQVDLVMPTADRVTVTATGALDRSVASDLYAALMVREVGWAITHGWSVLDVGPGAMADKVRLGCVPDARRAYAGLPRPRT